MMFNESDVKHYTLDNFKTDTRDDNGIIYLHIQNVPNKIFQRINKFIMDINAKYELEHHYIETSPKNNLQRNN